MQRTPPELKALVRNLRTNATKEERKLWSYLHDHKPRFTRQLLVSHYVIDLACRTLKLGIELDGGHHAHQQGKDAERTAYLESRGRTILRFWNNDVMRNPEGVVHVIVNEVAALSARR